VIAEDREKLLERAMARHRYSGDALIEVLHVAQQLYGYLSHPLLRTVARKLKLPPSRVLGVATFYHLFRFAPSREHRAVVCMGTACYAAGAPDLLARLRDRCGDNWTIEEARCVGSCGLAAVVNCDGAAWSRVTLADLEARLSCAAGQAPSAQIQPRQ
jgi:bidirectional [NiFe] hydrogenase diaphorase subunit